MEKYSRWRDGGTGIQPFLPPVPSRTEKDPLTHVGDVMGFVLKPVVGVLKSLLVIVVALLLFLLADVLGRVLIPIRRLHRAFHFTITCVLTRFALFLMGFYWVHVETVTLRKGRTHIAKTHDQVPTHNVSSGDIIVSNWTSYVEILYFAFRFDPVFTQLYPTTKTLRPLSLWQAIILAGSYPELEPSHGIRTYSLNELASEAAAKHWGPIVIFPETTTSNGRALLQFQIALFGKPIEQLVKELEIHIFAVRYDYQNFSPTYTAGSKLWHFFKLCSEYKNTLQIKHLASEELPLSIPITLKHDNAEAETWTELLNIVGQISRLRKTRLSAKDKQDFLQYYWERTVGSKKRQKVL